MDSLPHILFDSDAEIIYSTISEPLDIYDLFLKSLRRGDRINFMEFCAAAFDPEHPRFCIFQISGFPDAEYVFIEKDVLNSQSVNIAYFASDFSDLHQLMSPTSLFYQEITGKCIYDILRTSQDREMHLTPNGFLTIDRIPHLRDELVSDPRCIEYCCLSRVAELIVESCRNIPAFSEIELIFPDDAADDSLILALPLSSYVFLFTAILCILHTLSDDHRIRIEICPSQNRADAGFCIRISENRIRDIDSSSLLSLGILSPSADSLAKIASVVAFNSKIATFVTCAGGNLRTQITISDADAEAPHFHYRDPYTDIPSLVDEFLAFFELLHDNADLSRNEAQTED